MDAKLKKGKQVQLTVNTNWIRLAISIAALIVSIIFFFNVFTNAWIFPDIELWLLVVAAVLYVATISLFTISAIRSMTDSYRVFCVAFPIAAAFVPQACHWYGCLRATDPTDYDESILPLFIARNDVVVLASIITGIAIALAVLFWELKKAGIISGARLKEPSSIPTR